VSEAGNRTEQATVSIINKNQLLNSHSINLIDAAKGYQPSAISYQ